MVGHSAVTEQWVLELLHTPPYLNGQGWAWVIVVLENWAVERRNCGSGCLKRKMANEPENNSGGRR